LTWPHGEGFTFESMRGDGLRIGEISRRSGLSRKALRLYEANGILPVPRRTAAQYRMYAPGTLEILTFVRQARRLGFRLREIQEIVAIRRSGRAPCAHVRVLVERKKTDLDRLLGEAKIVRDGLHRILRGWASSARGGAAVCPHIESAGATTPRRTR